MAKESKVNSRQSKVKSEDGKGATLGAGVRGG